MTLRRKRRGGEGGGFRFFFSSWNRSVLFCFVEFSRGGEDLCGIGFADGLGSLLLLRCCPVSVNWFLVAVFVVWVCLSINNGRIDLAERYFVELEGEEKKYNIHLTSQITYFSSSLHSRVPSDNPFKNSWWKKNAFFTRLIKTK